MRGSEPTIVGSQQLMCLPLREGFKCPFSSATSSTRRVRFSIPSVGKQIPTKVNTNNIEKRAVPVPFLEKRQYADLHIVNGGSTFVMQMWDGVGFYLIAVDIMSGSVVPIYPDPLGVFVSGDNSVLMIAVEQGLALFSAQALAMPGITQEELLGSAVVWTPPEGWTVTVNPRAEWMQMYNEAMRNMRDAFYDPNMHGVDWAAITEQYRPLVYRISTKSELRDVLQQALGELSVLHVFVSIRNEQPSLPTGSRRRAWEVHSRITTTVSRWCACTTPAASSPRRIRPWAPWRWTSARATSSPASTARSSTSRTRLCR